MINQIKQVIQSVIKAIGKFNTVLGKWFYSVMLIKVLNVISDMAEFKVYSVILVWVGIYKLLQEHPAGNVANILVYAGILYTFISLFLREIQKPGSHVFLLLLNIAPWSKAQINIPPEFFRKPKDDGNNSSSGEVKL